MSIRFLALIVFALGAAGVTTLFTQNWLANERAQIMAAVPKVIERKAEFTQVLVAKTDLIPGSFMDDDKLEWQDWPEDAISDLMLEKGNVDMDDFTGSVIRTRVPAGQPVLPSAMVRSGEQGFLAAVLNPGMRAITVPLNTATGVGGFVFPGDRVDLLVTITLKPEGEASILKRKLHLTQTLLRDVRVIGKDQNAVQSEGEAKVAKSATLEVTPKQAEAVILANDIGDLSLSLRSLADADVILSEHQQGTQTQEAKALHKANFEAPAFPQALLVQNDVDPAPENTNTSASLERLGQHDEFSLTTDWQVNYLLQNILKYGAVQSAPAPQKQVDVHRGGATTTHKF